MRAVPQHAPHPRPPGLEDAQALPLAPGAAEYFPDPLLDGALYFRVRLIRGGEVEWVPVVDRNRQIALAGIMTIVAICALRSVVVRVLER